jgi:hypothetical protein
VSGAVCDVCGVPRARGERLRLVWDRAPGGALVLADLCARCAGESDRLLEAYGGRGHDAVRLTHGCVSPAGPAPLRRVGGIVVRGLFYVLLALATFVVVTIVTSRG